MIRQNMETTLKKLRGFHVSFCGCILGSVHCVALQCTSWARWAWWAALCSWWWGPSSATWSSSAPAPRAQSPAAGWPSLCSPSSQVLLTKKNGLWGFFKKPCGLLKIQMSFKNLLGLWWFIKSPSGLFQNLVWFLRFVWTENGSSENLNWFFGRIGRLLCDHNVFKCLF